MAKSQMITNHCTIYRHGTSQRHCIPVIYEHEKVRKYVKKRTIEKCHLDSLCFEGFFLFDILILDIYIFIMLMYCC